MLRVPPSREVPRCADAEHRGGGVGLVLRTRSRVAWKLPMGRGMDWRSWIGIHWRLVAEIRTRSSSDNARGIHGSKMTLGSRITSPDSAA